VGFAFPAPKNRGEGDKGCALQDIYFAAGCKCWLCILFSKYMSEGRLECSFQRHLHAVDVGLMIKVGTFGDQMFSPWGGVIKEDLHSRHISFGYSHCQDVLHNKEFILIFLMHFE